jgi:hypothetical protein
MAASVPARNCRREWGLSVAVVVLGTRAIECNTSLESRKVTQFPQSVGFMILPSIILPFIFRLAWGSAWSEDGRIIDGRMMKKHSGSLEFVKLENPAESMEMGARGKMIRRFMLCLNFQLRHAYHSLSCCEFE